jgi:DNA-binding transcriptional ArsR family regulator
LTKSVILPVSQSEGGLIREFYLVSSHGAVVFYIAVNPDCTIGDIAEAMALTRRTVWGLIGDLRRAGMLHVRKNGRRHYYTVNLDAPFLHPSVNGYALRALFGQIAALPQERTEITQAT